MVNRWKIGCVLALLIAWAGCPGCVSSRTAPAAQKERAIPFQRVQIGLCEDYPRETRSLASARQDFELLKTNGIRVLRIAFPWDALETAPDKYDWSFWDDFVRIATVEYGLQLIPYVCYTPRWASTGNATNFWRQPPRDNARFAEFVRTIVARYRSRIHSWEIWNEPDNPEYWEGSTEQYANLLKTGSRAVREADPGARVVLGGIAWNLDFLRDLFARYQISPEIDVVNLHNYYETWSPDPIEQIGDHVLRADSIIREYGSRQPIWLAEVGYSDYRRGASVSGAYKARFDYEHTPEFQAESLGRMFASALATGRVQLIAWYRIHDLPPTTRVIGDDNNRRLGVVDVQGRPKPVLRAIAFFQFIFAGDFRCLDSITRETRLIRSDGNVHVFEKRDGESFIAAWLNSVDWLTPPGAGVDRRHEKLDILLPKPRASQAYVYDALGNRQSTASLRKVAGDEKSLTIPLRPGELKVYECPP